jgi:hypothetical protein
MNSTDFFYSLTPFPLSDFGNYFDNFKKSAFRLELLSSYNIPEEKESYNLFLNGITEPPKDFNKEWYETLSSAKHRKKEISRVRVIDGRLTNYIKFEILWAYKRSILEGEDIGFILRPEIDIFQTPVPILKDFWLFDEADCFLMEYDYVGTFLGTTRVPESVLPVYIDLMKEVKALSVPFDKGMQELGL